MLVERGPGDTTNLIDSLRDAVLADSDPCTALAALAQVANDESLRPRHRVEALLGVATAAALGDLPIPASALAAVEDPVVIETALRRGLAHALTGVLGRAPADPGLRATRQMIGRLLLAAGQRGPHITALLIDAGDFPAAARAAADEFISSVLPAAEHPNVTALAWAGIALGWFESHGESVFAPLLAELNARNRDAAPALARLIARVPDANPVLVDAARTALLGNGDRN